MKVLPMIRKRRILEVSNKTAIFPCELNGTELKVFDKYGNEIPSADCSNPCCNNKNVVNNTNNPIAIFSDDGLGIDFMRIGHITVNDNRNFVFDGYNQIELNFDTDKIQVESYEVATYHDDYYDCEVPYIYDNGLLLEALSWYCLFKYLSRGSHHPIYDLKSNSPITNPYIQWNTLRPKAMASVKNDIAMDHNGWNNFFYNSTFLPRLN